MSEIIVTSSYDSFSFSCEHYYTGKFVYSLAESVILFCQNPPPNIFDPEDLDNYPIVNRVQSQVEFIYQIVKHCKIINDVVLFSSQPGLASCVMSALEHYQEFKTKICQKDEELNGVGFGSALAFYRMNWTDMNDWLGGHIDDPKKS